MKKTICLLGFLVTALCAGCGTGDSVDELLKAGNEAYDERNYTQAREYYLRGLEIDNQDRDLLLACGKAYRQDYMLDSAIYYFKRADLMHPDDREVNEQVREVAKTLGDWQNAIDAIEVLARLDGTKEPYHVELAELRFKNNQPARSLYHARCAILAGVDLPGLYLQAASLATTMDSIDVAIEVLDVAIAKYGPREQFLTNRASLLAYKGNMRQAEGDLRLIISQSNSPPPGLKLNLANVLGAQPERAKKEEALRLYEEVRDLMSQQYPIDSLMQALRDELE
jgi:tetratricopeptide (TPR) repeat protein